MDHSDEDTNGSFEIIDKVGDSSETDSDTKPTEDKNELKDDNKATENEWEDVLGSGHLLKKVSYGNLINLPPLTPHILQIHLFLHLGDQ